MEGANKVANIIVRNYEHYNSSMGKYISSKKQYYEEMKKGGYIPLEEAKQVSESRNKQKTWTPSKECLDVTRELYNKKDKTIRLGDYPKIVEAMEKKGMSFDVGKLPNQEK